MRICAICGHADPHAMLPATDPHYSRRWPKRVMSCASCEGGKCFVVGLSWEKRPKGR